MKHSYREPTFGFEISSARRALKLSQNQMLSLNPGLSSIIGVRELNELEQDRSDPRCHSRAAQLFIELSSATGIAPDRLCALADDHDRALALQIEFQRTIEFEAVAYRARTERG
jgi:hypothetical protein